MEWQHLYEDHGFCDEHRERFNQLSQEALMMLIPELASYHPGASALLKNKCLTAPQHILARVAEE